MLRRTHLPETHVQPYAAPYGSKLEDERVWEAANLDLDAIKSRAYILDSARMPVATPVDQSKIQISDLNERLNPVFETVVTVH